MFYAEEGSKITHTTIMRNHMHVRHAQTQMQSIVFAIGKTIVHTIYLLSNDPTIGKTIVHIVYLISNDPTIFKTTRTQ